LWAAAKAGLTGRFLALNANMRKDERSKTNNLSLHLKTLGKEEQVKFRVHKRKEKTRITAYITKLKIGN
jgi:hypothetical protein